MEQQPKINWNNREERNAYNRKWCSEHPGFRKESGRLYRQKNKARIQVYANQWAKNNPEKVRNWHREWREKNRHKYAEEKRLYRSKHHDRDHARDLAKYFVLHWYCCMGCGSEDKPLEEHHPDYLKPLETFSLCKECHKIADREKKKKEQSFRLFWAFISDSKSTEMRT